MAHTYAAHGTRQTTVVAAIIALHFGVFLAIVTGTPIRDPIDPPRGVFPIKPPPEAPPEPIERPIKVELIDDYWIPVEEPVFPMPDFEPSELAPTEARSGAATSETSAGSGPVDYRQASLRTRDQRIAALVAACYPAGSRRLGEEGKAIARIVLDAQGKVMSWSLHSSSGFARLDASLGCVLKHLQFNAARRDGQAVAATIDLPIVFRLD